MTIDSNTSIFLGQREIVEIKIGNTTIWQKSTTPVVEPDYFYIENTSGETDNLVVKVIHNDGENIIPSSSYTHSIEYSKDKTNWTTLDTSSETEYQISFDDGDKVYFRNDTGVFNYQIGGPCHTIRFNTENITYSAGGDIRTLLDYTDVDNITMSNGCFANLFSGYTYTDYETWEEFTVEGRCNDASNLTLPSSVAPFCYYQMFWNCTSLTTAPSLPATTLAADCYNEMFNQCYSLTTTPSLPATTLATRCYMSMFSSCSALNTAPSLPATNLEEACYSNMFANCSALTTAPSLPATTLSDYCYANMFENCYVMTTTPILPATTLANGCYYYMFNGCYSLTTAPSLPATTLADNCYTSMFSYCSSITSAPSLPATTLAYGCYQMMFQGTGITTPPSLPATELADYCYAYMFAETNISTAPALPVTTLANGCYQSMFNSCGSLTTAPELPATKLAQLCYQSMFTMCVSLTTPPTILPATDLTGCESCYNEMFSNCESLTSVPILPATTLSGGCYMDMFTRCTSLTTGPALPADTLAENCYANMFFGCTNIQSVITYADDITADGCTSNWLGGEDVWDDEQQMDVSTAPPSGTIYNGGSATYLVDDYSGIPVGWSEASVPTITSVGSVPSTFTAKSWMDKARVSYTIVGHNTTGIDVPLSNVTEKVNIGVNTGNTSLTYTESKTYDAMSFSYTITQSANDTDEPDYFWIESTNGYATVSVYGNNTGSPSTDLYTPTIEYSTDRTNWTSVTLSTGMNSLSPAIGVGQKMYFRNDTGVFSCYEAYNSHFKYSITASNKINVGGSVNTLLDYFVTSPSMPKGCFNRLFNAAGSQNIISASSLVLPNKTSEFCYEDMFNGCSNLTAAPTLPATKLEQYCYEEMFNGCTSLTTAPSLPATTLAQSCYSGMFNGCTSLTTAPSLPATTLENYCYQMMFNGCSSLTTAPSLPALVLTSQCYYAMFYGCSSLVNPPSLPATTLASNCYTDMFHYCTSLTTAPALPATTLVTYCYSQMFQGCTSLTTAPALPATTLVNNCYSAMFANCTNLNTVICYANSSPKSGLTNWLLNVSSTGTFYKLGSTNYPSGASGIPTGWTVETTPPNQ